MGIHIITQGVRNRTWVPNTDTPVIYGIKRLNNIIKSHNIYNKIIKIYSKF